MLASIDSRRPRVRRLALWLGLAKLFYLGLVLGALGVFGDLDTAQFHAVNARWPREGGPIFASHFATWDAVHYLYLSEVGYAKDVPSCAFYPLWPLCIRAFSAVTGGSHLVAGLVLANVFSLAGWFLFYRITARRFGEGVAGWALVCLLLYPGSLFFQFIYSEPLFFLLVMALWFGLEEHRDEWVWTAGLLLPMARGVGVFCVLPIAWICLMRQPWKWLDRWEWLREERERIASRSRSLLTADRSAATSTWACWLTVLAPPAGLALVFLLMWFWTGNALEGIEAQKYWGVHAIRNLWDVPKFVVGFTEPTAWHAFSGSALDRLTFLLPLYMLPVLWRLGKDLVLWAYVLAVLPAMSGTFVSFTRFQSVAFPVFIALAVFFTSFRARWPLALFLAVMTWGHLWLLWRFVNFRWAG